MRGLLAVLLSLAPACGDNLVPYEVPELPVLYEGTVMVSNLAVSEGRVYFTTFGNGEENEHAVLSVPADGGEPTRLWQGAPRIGVGMAVHDGEVFWSQEDEPTSAVFSVPIGGGDRTRRGRFETSQAGSSGVTVDDDWIFAGSDDEIIQIPRRGAESVVVYRGSVQWIDREGGPLYFLADDWLQRLDPASGEVSRLVAMTDTYRFALAGDLAYFSANDAVWSVPLTVGGRVTRIARMPGAGALAVGPDALVVAMGEGEGSMLVRIALDGGQNETLYPVRWPDYASLVLDNGALYVAHLGQVLRLDL